MDKTNFAAMRAASALYRQMAAEYYAQEIRTPGIEAEVMANLYDSLAVLHHPETDAAKTAQAALDTAVDKMLLQTKSDMKLPRPISRGPKNGKTMATNKAAKDVCGSRCNAFKKRSKSIPNSPTHKTTSARFIKRLTICRAPMQLFTKPSRLIRSIASRIINLANSYHTSRLR